MRPAFIPLLNLFVLGCCVLIPHSRAEELTTENYAHWRDYALPTASEERWRKIPWIATFYEGVAEAQQSKKPLLIWVMNGHPLACT